MVCCVVLRCAVLCCVVLYCVVVNCNFLPYIVLYRIGTHFALLLFCQVYSEGASVSEFLLEILRPRLQCTVKILDLKMLTAQLTLFFLIRNFLSRNNFVAFKNCTRTVPGGGDQYHIYRTGCAILWGAFIG